MLESTTIADDLWISLFSSITPMWLNRFNHTRWVAIIIQTNRPKSVCNRCVIEVLVAF